MVTSGDVVRRWCRSVMVGGEIRDAGTRTIDGGDVARRWCRSVVVDGRLRDVGTRTICQFPLF